MIRAEWTVRLVSGPVVGSADVDDAGAAWFAFRTALRGALGKSWGPDHEAAVAQLERSSRVALDRGDSWSHVSTAFVITLTRTG